MNRGIFVSSMGFTDPGLSKARALGIGCFSLQEAIGFDWCLAPGMFVRRHELLQLDINIDVDGDIHSDAILQNDEGAAVDQQMLTNIGMNCLQPLRELDEPVDKPIIRDFVDYNPNLFVASGSGVQSRVKKIDLRVTYKVREYFSPFEFNTYRNSGGEATNYSVASCKIDSEVLRGRLMFIKYGEGIRVAFVRDSNSIPEERKLTD